MSTNPRSRRKPTPPQPRWPKDPAGAREAERYERPIPSREYLLQALESAGHPLALDALCTQLKLSEETDCDALRRRLKAMLRDGQLVINRRDEYGIASKMDLVSGRIVGHPDGYGFLVPDDSGPDLFLSARELRCAMHGDRVMARVTGIDRRGRREGAIVEVLERAHRQLVGRLLQERGLLLVVPDNPRIQHDILIPAGALHGAQPGQIVSVRLTAPPAPHAQAVGEIIEVLGDHMAPGMEIDIAIRAHGLPQQWPDEVLAEIEGLDPVVVPETAKAGRIDLRELPLVTIDGEDAQDFDDAVYCEQRQSGFRLIVAIADVSAYVTPGTALDREALLRGNSAYFPGRVIPMLPEVLSNGLCSINPRVDRLCFVCDMSISAEGQITRSRFYQAVMRSAARLTYTAVADWLRGERNALPDALAPALGALHALYRALARARQARGAIDFETVETKIEFSTGRKIERIVPVERNDAHKLIEECMIAANVCAARFLMRHKIAGLYRVHGGPSPEKLTDLRSFLGEFGLQLRGGDEPEAQHYARLLREIEPRPDRMLLQTVLLRSLQQAQYNPTNNGHFGLALPAYTHFTSPIRRYPDLLVHRAIAHILAGGKAANSPYTPADMASFGEHCSATERRADEATRDAADWLKCEYMLDKVGQEFDGIVSAVLGFGLFVQLTGIYIEGLAHITTLGSDYFHFDPVGHRLSGERTGLTYRLGQPLRVRLTRVDLDERKIDLEPAAARPDKKNRSGRRSR